MPCSSSTMAGTSETPASASSKCAVRAHVLMNADLEAQRDVLRFVLADDPQHVLPGGQRREKDGGLAAALGPGLALADAFIILDRQGEFLHDAGLLVDQVAVDPQPEIGPRGAEADFDILMVPHFERVAEKDRAVIAAGRSGRTSGFPA